MPRLVLFCDRRARCPLATRPPRMRSGRACLRSTQLRPATRPDRDGGAGSVTARSSGRATLVAMVQAADLWEGDNVAGRGRLYRTRLGAILAEREMRAASMVILKVCRQHTAQVMLIGDDDVIETRGSRERISFARCERMDCLSLPILHAASSARSRRRESGERGTPGTTLPVDHAAPAARSALTLLTDLFQRMAQRFTRNVYRRHAQANAMVVGMVQIQNDLEGYRHG